jgi:hypothetical protein
MARPSGAVLAAAICGIVIGSIIGAVFATRASNAKNSRRHSLRPESVRFTSSKDIPDEYVSKDVKKALFLDGSPSDCPKDLAGWTAWRDQQVGLILKPTFKSPSGEMVLNRDDVNAAAATTFALLDKCVQADPSSFDPLSDLGKALSPLYKFSNALHWMTLRDANGFPNHQMGFSITDTDYYTFASPYLQFPDLLKSSTFLNAIATPAGYSKAVQMITDRNAAAPNEKPWQVVLFKARFITTVDPGPTATYGRLLVVVPDIPTPYGGTMDKWILFGLITPDMDQTLSNQNVSQFTVYTDKSLQQTTYMMDFDRKPNAAGGVDITPIVARGPGKYPSKNCYDCHKLSILPIHPDTEYKFDSAGKLIPKTATDPLVAPGLNEIIADVYTAPNFPKMDVDAYGPPAGPQGRTRSDDFIKYCSKNSALTAQSLIKIKAAMNCSTCHSNDGNGSLNYLQATMSKRDFLPVLRDNVSMIDTFVGQGWMPPHTGLSLSSDERAAVSACVTREYFDPSTNTGVLVDYLEAKPVIQ